MREYNDVTKIEFLLSLNENIIVQRFFNVKNFNYDAKNSLEIYEYIKSFKEELEYNLKMRTVCYMIDNIHQIMDDAKVLETSFTDDAENFNIIINLENETICHRSFDAKLFPPKIRYTVDIRPLIKSLLYDLTEILSDEDLTFDYLGLPLNV